MALTTVRGVCLCAHEHTYMPSPESGHAGSLPSAGSATCTACSTCMHVPRCEPVCACVRACMNACMRGVAGVQEWDALVRSGHAPDPSSAKRKGAAAHSKKVCVFGGEGGRAASHAALHACLARASGCVQSYPPPPPMSAAAMPCTIACLLKHRLGWRPSLMAVLLRHPRGQNSPRACAALRCFPAPVCAAQADGGHGHR